MRQQPADGGLDLGEAGHGADIVRDG
jgi:hypothetical protein